jgi:hypothetical protein
MMVAREAIVITVGAKPIEYGEITVRHNKTDEIVTIPNQNHVIDEGDEGIPYAFKANQRVRNDHPAVKANPGAFIPADEVDPDDQQPAA